MDRGKTFARRLRTTLGFRIGRVAFGLVKRLDLDVTVSAGMTPQAECRPLARSGIELSHPAHKPILLDHLHE